MKFIATAVLALALVAGAATGAQAATKTIPLPVIAGYASVIAGQPVTIVCDTPSDKSGEVHFDDESIHLTPGECSTLEAVGQSARINTLTGFAMLVLQHEAEHLALNSADEGLVECTAVENRFQLVRLFKLPARVAKQIMAWELDAHNAITVPAYRATC